MDSIRENGRLPKICQVTPHLKHLKEWRVELVSVSENRGPPNIPFKRSVSEKMRTSQNISGDISFKNSILNHRVVSVRKNGGPLKMFQVNFPLKTVLYNGPQGGHWSVSEKMGYRHNISCDIPFKNSTLDHRMVVWKKTETFLYVPANELRFL